MKDFGELNISVESSGFIGEKISIMSIINVNIIVEKFKVGPSKFKDKGPRLDLQIIYKNAPRVTWVCSKYLIEMIQKVPASSFPFMCQIIREPSGRMIFTGADKNT